MLILTDPADAQKSQYAKDAKANIILHEKVTCASICMPNEKTMHVLLEIGANVKRRSFRPLLHAANRASPIQSRRTRRVGLIAVQWCGHARRRPRVFGLGSRHCAPAIRSPRSEAESACRRG